MRNKARFHQAQLLCLVMTLMLFVLGAGMSPAQAADISLGITCVDHSQPDRAIIHFGYFASETVQGTGYFGPVLNVGGDLPPNTLEAGQHDDVFTAEIYAPAVWQFVSETGQVYELRIDTDTTGADCAAQWHPGAPSIYITLESDCAFVETKDYSQGQPTGHWSRVESNGEPVLLHYGEALIGGPGQSANPDDYRTVATACY